MKHVISVGDFDLPFIDGVLASAESYRMTWEKGEPLPSVSDQGVVRLLFGEPSTRTAGSFEEAARLLGLPHVLTSGAEGTSLVKGETLGATARMFCGYNGSALVMRTKVEGAPRWVAEMAARRGMQLCVLNAGDGANEHPSQTLLDLYTIRRHLGRLNGFKIGFVGDFKYSRTVHSLIRALRLLEGVEIVLVSAPEAQLQWWYTRGMYNVTVASDLETLAGCHLVYATRVQRERFPSEYEYHRVAGRFTIDQAALDMLGSKVLVMHPLPIGDNEIHPSVLGDPRVIIDAQAANGVPIRMALLNEALHSRCAETPLEVIGPEIEDVRSGSADEAIARKQLAQQRFLPISNGTVLDHLPVGFGRRIQSVLGLDPNAHYVGLDQGLRSNGQGGKKDTLRLEDVFLNARELSAIGILVPQVTINEIRDGVLTKRRVATVREITGIGSCPNPACVTRCDAEAALYPHFHVNGEGREVLACHYCEQHFDRREVLVD